MTAPNNEIDRKAAEWLVRADAENFSEQDKARLEAWLSADPRHFGAYIRLRAALSQLQRLGRAAQARNMESQIPDLPAAKLEQPRRRFLLIGSIAASLMLLVLGGTVWNATSFAAGYATGVGETKAVTLPDGSVLTLNTDSKASVHFTFLARDIVLDRGEVLFDVTKSKVRPFLVRAGHNSVRAVGTSFSVTALKDRPFQVLVREGTVELRADGNAQPVSLPAGWRAVARSNGGFELNTVPQDQIGRDLAWQKGYIVFKHQELASAVREFERYSRLQIVVEDPVAAHRTITGMYVAADPAGFARAVSTFLDLDVSVRGDEIRLTHKRNGATAGP